MAKPILVLLFLLIFSLPNSIFKLSYSIIVCPEIEKEALLSFKQSLKDPSNRLSSWNMSNCCNWKGVVCSNITGNVHQLHLQRDEDEAPLQGKINPSLLQLKHLKHLDLSGNDFYERIPSFIGSITRLEYLNLSDNGFYGKIPATIGNLSRLHTLSFEYSFGGLKYVNGTWYGREANVEDFLHADSVEWLKGLSQLEHLNMNYVNLVKAAAAHWMQVINTLPSLVELRLSSCGLNFNFDPPSHVNITSLTILDLSGNKFESFSIPKWIFRLSNLVFLDLSRNNFRGPIPSVTNITKLQYIDLSGNDLNSTIPDWLYSCQDLEFLSLSKTFVKKISYGAIGNLTSLTTLTLSDNQLSGEIPREILNLCYLQTLDLSNNMLQGEIPREILNLCKLQKLDLSNNMLQGEIPREILNLCKLQTLDLSNNMFQGEIPREILNLCKLQKLDLSNNMLQGEIPDIFGHMSGCFLQELLLRNNKLIGNLPMSVGQLSNLDTLDIENNNMKGVVTESHFANLSKLSSLIASGNHLTLKLSLDWNPLFKVGVLRLGSWNLGAGSDIPPWIETQKSTRLIDLDLSNTGISGNVPTWFWKIPILNLSNNHLSGNIPDLIGYDFIRAIYLNSNQFSGHLPRIGGSESDINLSNNLLSGGLSHFLCPKNGYGLLSLNLQGNQLTGKIPNCWMNWPGLMVVNLGDNNFSGSIPNSIGALKYLFSLNLQNNKLSGQIPVSITNCTDLVTMDLSGNDLVGNIPTGIGTSLPNLRLLILRSNKLGGTIPWSICHLKSLQIFDLSNNAFFGRIPSCLNNFTAMTVKRNLSDSIGTVIYFSSLTEGKFLEGASVVTKGKLTHYDTILWLVNTIDLSRNNLSGGIPKELTSLVELKWLNLSGNHLTGSIPESIGDLKQLESLDLSRNTLSGEMPDSFSAMFSLSYLNLSCNNLSGRIPESTQLRGMDASSFVGNDLCGPPLTTKCPGDDDGGGGDDDAGNKEDDDESEIEWLYVSLSLGYALGSSAFCTTLVFKKPRRAYFELLECMWDKIYVHYHITCTKLMRRRSQTS